MAVLLPFGVMALGAGDGAVAGAVVVVVGALALFEAAAAALSKCRFARALRHSPNWAFTLSAMYSARLCIWKDRYNKVMISHSIKGKDSRGVWL